MKLKTLKKIIVPSILTMTLISSAYFVINKSTLQAKEDDKATSTEEYNTEEMQNKIAESLQTEIQEVEVKPSESFETQEELANKQYDVMDSARLIKVNYNDIETPTTFADASSDVIISDAYLVTNTGTSPFDDNDNPGYDSSSTNNLVRTYDQIVYTLNFSIQNISATNYSNFKYRIFSTLDNAIIDDGTNPPQVRASAVNGAYGKYSDSNNYYAQSVINSTLETSGQITMPISFNVLANDNGEQIVPTFKIELISGTNNDTGETVYFYQNYDKTNMPKMEAPITYVSAMPSIKVQMIQGSNGTQLLKDGSKRGYDVGVDTMLSPIPTRGANDYRGATFPKGPITYSIKSKGTYTQENGIVRDLETSQYNEFQIEDYCGPNKDRTTANWKNGAVNLNTDQMMTLSMPEAYSKGIYVTEANESSTPPSYQRGVYNSGNFNVAQNGYNLNVTNQNYTRVINPYMYDMNGSRMTEITYSNIGYNKTFTSLENVFSWDYTKTENLGLANSWSRYDMTLYIDEVSYDGYTNKVDTSVKYSSLLKKNTGWYRTTPGIGAECYPFFYMAPGSAQYGFANANQGVDGWLGNNYGNATLYNGAEVMLTDYAFSNDNSISSDLRESEFIVMWDPTAFKYDGNPTRQMYSNKYTLINAKQTYKYGVAYNIDQVSSTTMKVGTVDETYPQYQWFNTAAEAEAVGDISAIDCLTTFDGKDPTVGNLENCIQVPVVVTATKGNLSPAGNPVVCLGTHKFTDKNGNIAAQAIEDGGDKANGYPVNGYGTYGPTDYNPDGSVAKLNMTYSNFIGESAWVRDFGITTYTTVDKSNYDTTDLIQVQLDAHIRGSLDSSYSASFKTTLPKGILYVKGSSYDTEGNSIADPTVVLNSDGQYELTYLLPATTNIKQDQTIKFTAKTKPSELTFKTDGTTDTLQIDTTGEVWLTDTPSVNDDRAAKYRSSKASFIENLKQQITVRKTHNKNLLEVGDDNQFGTTNTEITYNVSMINSKLETVGNTKVVDVLPYNGDSRGTKMNGSLKITAISFDSDSAKGDIYYTNTAQDDKLDPNNINLNTYTKFIPGTTPISDIENAKAIVITKDKMDINEEISVNITVKPTDSKAGDVIINNANMNSALNLLVNSAKVKTEVYSRNVSGIAWYDINEDGLIEDTEPRYENMPVKLYRKTIENGVQVNTLVKHDLKGNKFIDDSGNILVKTDSNGNYQFDNLPEGDYYAHFAIQDEINSGKLIVTKQNVGNDINSPINSKASTTAAATYSYNLPNLTTISQTTGLTNNTYSVPYINIGVYQQAGEVTIFKYEEGTAKDKDGDGKLSDEEKATGKALENVTFELYKADTNEKINEGKTDASGNLTFGNLAKGDYYIIETKTIDGYELVKTKLKFTIDKDNLHIKLFVANSKQTILPFTGSTTANIIILAAISTLTISIIILGTQFFKKKKVRKAIPRKR